MDRIMKRHRRRGPVQEPRHQQFQTRGERFPVVDLHPFSLPVSAPDASNEDWRNVARMEPAVGECKPGTCGPEAACMKFSNNTYTCICPHDSSPPTLDLKCPNRLTVPLTPQPIHNIIPPSGSNSTSTTNSTSFKPSHAEVQPSWETNALNSNAHIRILGIGILFFTLLLISGIVCIWKRKAVSRCFGKDVKSRTAPCSTSPMNLKKSLLVAERYTPNPQYSACTSPSVSVLNREALSFLQEIGEGCFGKVFKGHLQCDNGGDEENVRVEIVAIKVLKESAGPEAEEEFMREVDIMSAFRHKNILSLVGVVLREAGQSPWMVFEYMPHGDLAEVLRSNCGSPLWQAQPHAGLPTTLTKAHLLSAAQQIASGMRYLAAQRFVHRDLACRNCLVGTGLTVKIADFGMSRDVYTCDYYKIGGSRLLPVRWMSPESVMYGRFTLESDIWSYGVVLWEIFSLGKQPYYGHNNEEVLKLILQGIMLIPPDDCPGEVCDLMRCCWKTEPRDRIRFNEICERLDAIAQSATSTTNLMTSSSNTLAVPNFSSLYQSDTKPRTTCVNSLQRGQNGHRQNRKKSTQRSTSVNTLFYNENENEKHLKNSSSFSTCITLPRPPPVPVVPNIKLLDSDGYLMPSPAIKPTEYMETLPD